MDDLVRKIDRWIDETLEAHCSQMISCKCLYSYFGEYYSEEFLNRCVYVVVNKLPKPDFSELREMGFGGFIDGNHDGITYKNCYFVKLGHDDNMYLHFHELAHVCQWEVLGAEKFIEMYMNELVKHGYDDAPLEQMAQAFEYHYASQGESIDVEELIRAELTLEKRGDDLKPLS